MIPVILLTVVEDYGPSESKNHSDIRSLTNLDCDETPGLTGKLWEAQAGVSSSEEEDGLNVNPLRMYPNGREAGDPYSFIPNESMTLAFVKVIKSRGGHNMYRFEFESATDET